MILILFVLSGSCCASSGADLGVTFYKQAGAEGEQANCWRCGESFGSKLQMDDLRISR
ncbi:MAG: hypothetical protein U5R31_08915 [Acidimicrobiia bacterium]|nr:hypothetical protein [Acidimicrobiia bacterium]